MGGRKRGGFFFRWMKSDLPDREENPTPVLLLAVHKTSGNNYSDKSATTPDRYTNPCSDHCESCTPRTDRHKHLFSQLNERFRKTLSLDSRVNRNTCTSLQHDCRPKSMVNATNIDLNNCSINAPNAIDKPCKNKRFRPKSFFTLESFLNSRRSEASSADDFSSSKYCKFYLDSSAECSPVLKGRTTPDLLNLPNITVNGTHLSEESRCKKQLDKLENHFNRIQKLKSSTITSDRVEVNTKNDSQLIEEPIYTEPVYNSSVGIKTDKLYCTTLNNEDNFTRVPDFNSNSDITKSCARRRGTDNRTEKDKFFKSEPIQPLYTNFSRTYNKVDYTSPCNFNSDPADFFIPIRPDKDLTVYNNREHEVSQSPDPHCSSFKDCSNVLRKSCNVNCSNSRCLTKSKGICCKEGTPSSAYEINITEDDLLMNDQTKNLIVKVMDKSVDSIGSCSLDVDADNTDFSDTTSGSLNILTPSSTTSHYRDFATKFQERATPALRQDLRGLPLREEVNNKTEDISVQPKLTQPFLNYTAQPKKPSYLHLACSINGYSNLTTYDSTLRQKLSRSRENSPARPGNISSFVMLRNRTEDAMAQRLNLNAANSNNSSFFKTSFSETSISSQNVLTYLKSNGQNVSSETHTSKSYHVISNGAADQSPSKSFIQQRVERLYGPGALAQGFFNQKKTKDELTTPNGVNSVTQVSRNQHVLIKKTVNGVTSENTYSSTENYTNGQDDGDTVLPVMRHLRAEFRAQLPLLSPKRSPLAKISDNSNIIPTNSKSDQVDPSIDRLPSHDVVDRGINLSQLESNIDDKKLEIVKTSKVTIIPITKSESSEQNDIPSTNGNVVKTGDYSDVHKIVVENGKSNTISDINNMKCEENIPIIEKPLETLNVVVNDDINEKGNIEKLQTEKIDKIQDGQYFLDIKHAETVKLLEYANLAEKYLDELQDLPDITEEVRGFLRAAAGKARLLASQKMQQFEGLCHNNINGRPDDQFPTTVEDLRGFWDMVCLQIDDVRTLFEQINEMKTTGWKEVPLPKRSSDHLVKSAQTARTKSAKPKKSSTNQPDSSMKAAIAKKREEQRKALLEAKRRAVKMDCDSVEIFAPPPPQSSESLPTKSEDS